MNDFKPFLPFLVLLSCRPNLGTAPAPVDPLPTAQQLAWHEMEFYAFIHFNMNTFTNMEWGLGDEKPAQFNPTELDCRQWVRVCQEAGMQGIIITAKHHDGFCLWPSKYTDHSVKNAPWREGKGDLIQELREACDEYGLKFGIYYSPWDRNHRDYGKPAYLTYMRNQLEELLTQYGEVFEVWFDGANGGTGYYGGANEERHVDKEKYYDWKNTWDLVHQWQPNTLIFSDAGPDIRWVGNESGYAFRTMWSNLNRDSIYPGMVDYAERFASGQEKGSHFVPGETNVSIRPGWYYHPYEDHKVRSQHELLEMYYQSIGRNTTWLLNFPVDDRGLIHDNDAAQLQKLSQKIKSDFSSNLLKDVKATKATATNQRGTNYSIRKSIDGNPETYWAPDDHITKASLIFEFEKFLRFNRLVLQEYIALGQRIISFSVKADTKDGWQEIGKETTIGYKRILRFSPVEAKALRIDIKEAKACPTISNLEIYLAPKLVVPPTILRDKEGMVTLEVPEKGVDIYYTTDGSIPDRTSVKYVNPFALLHPTILKSIANDGTVSSEVSTATLDIAAVKWSILTDDKKAVNAIDGNPNTWWTPAYDAGITVDLGENLPIAGFTYLPMQERWISGFIDRYQFFTSADAKNWNLIKDGEFSNILNAPIQQRVTFSRQEARYIKIKSLSTVDDKAPSFAEISIITQTI